MFGDPPGKPKRKPKRKAPIPSGDFQALVACYHDAFEHARGAKPVIGSRTGKAAKALLDVVPLDVACAMVRRAFEDDAFLRQGGELWLVSNTPNKYLPQREPEPVEPEPFEPPEISPEELEAQRKHARDVARSMLRRVVSA